MSSETAIVESSNYKVSLHDHQIVVQVDAHDTTEVKQGLLKSILFVRINRSLLIFVQRNKEWIEVQREEVFFSVGHKTPLYPWDVFDDGWLLVRKTEGLYVYRWTDAALKIVTVFAEYHDAFGYGDPGSAFQMGKIFPADKRIGVVTRLNSTVEFRSIELTNTGKPLQTLSRPPKLGVEWTYPSSRITLIEHIDEKPQLSIALRTESELQLFRFDEQYELKLLPKVVKFPPISKDYDRIVFAKFDNTKYNDLLHFSNDGLMMYRYNQTVDTFEKVYYSTAFSKLRGWTDRTVETIMTIDINGDGIDELFGSGPKGLLALRCYRGNLGFDFSNILDDHVKDLSIRYGLIRLVENGISPGNKREVLLQTSDGLAKIHTKLNTSEPKLVTSSPAPSEFDLVEESSPPTPEKNRFIPELFAQGSYTLWLHDQLDLSTLLQPFNPHSGTVELTLPLIDIRNPFGVGVRKNVQYKNIDYSNELGRGWSFPLDYIMVDRKMSAFSQDHIYSFVKDNQRIILKRLPEHAQRIGDMSFAIEGYDDVKIRYIRSSDTWEVKIENRTLQYKVIKNYQLQNVCPSWPLCGPTPTEVNEQATIWYLISEIDTTGQAASYDYELVKQGSDIRLITITMNDGSLVKLSYEQDRVSSFAITTAKYEQSVQFHYTDGTDGTQLRAITQSDRKLFEFEYDQQDRLSRMVYPNGVVWSAEYTDLVIDPSALNRNISISHTPSIFYGPDYMVVVDANAKDGIFEMHVRDPLGAESGPKTNQTITLIALPDFKSHTVHALERLMVVTVMYKSSKDIAILQYTGDTGEGWIHRAYHSEFPLEGTVAAGNAFALISDTKQLHVLTVTEAGNYSDFVVRSNLPTNFVVHAFAHGYATFDQTMRIYVLRDDAAWMECTASPNWDSFAAIDKFVASFAISDELKGSMRKGLIADMLSSYRQALILKAPVFAGSRLEIWVRFMMLNLTDAPKVSDYYTVKLELANMNTFTYTVRTQENDAFHLGYAWHENKYHLRVNNSSGPHREAFEKRRKEVQAEKANMHYREWAKLWNDTVAMLKREYARIYKTVKDAVVFALDLSQFGLLTNADGVLVGGHQIKNEGNNWVKQRLIEDTLRMRKVDKQLMGDYRLVKENAEAHFKLVSNSSRATLFDIGTPNPKELQLVLPAYVQSQRPSTALKVFFMDHQKTVTMPQNETMNQASNQLAIITTYQEDAAALRTWLKFRSVKYFVDSRITVFAKQTLTAPFQQIPLVTEHQYDVQDLQLSADGFVFRKLKLLPGGKPTQFGWYEQSIDLQTGTTLRKAFAADGHEVLDPRLRDEQKKKQAADQRPSQADLDRMILDKGDRLQVLDLGSYRMADEMVGYYGFEKYEKNAIGVQKRWMFDQKFIVRDSENRYLRLTNRESNLIGTFEPAVPNTTFVVSCWIRTQAPSVGQSLDILTVQVLTKNGTSSIQKTLSAASAEVKHQIGNWSYIETILDVTHFSPATKLSFLITVIPTEAHPKIDIDHIRFSPLTMPLAINVYKPITGELRAILGTNGLPRYCFYNPQGKKSIMFSEHAEVLELSVESKIMFTRQMAARPCLIELKPRHSSFNHFGPELWRRTGVEWLIEHGSATYHGLGNATISRTLDTPCSSLSIRFVYKLLPPARTALSFSWRGITFPLHCSVVSTECTPSYGEILIVLTEVRASIWLDGVLLQEALLQKANSDRTFTLHSTGPFEISEFVEMYDARIKITYHNLSGQPTQLVVYEDPDRVRVREIWYDEIERPIMQTKWTQVHRTADEPQFFGYYERFIVEMDKATERLTGMVDDLHATCEGYPYSRTIYSDNPTDSKQIQGLPGKMYGITGKYRRRYSSRPLNKWLNTLFPVSAGYHHRVVEHPGGAIRVTVEDNQGNKVAKYSKVGNYDDRLTTYRFNNASKVVQELPPLYHSMARTMTINGPFFHTGPEPSDDLLKLQKLWEVRNDYENGGQRMIRRRTPDGGITHYLYDRQGALRFTLHKDHEDQLDRVIHFVYAANGKVAREALVNLTHEECNRILESNEDVPRSNDTIETLYGEQENQPRFRYRSQLSTRYIGDDHMTENLIFGERELLLKKAYVINTINMTYSIDYEWQNDKLRSVVYPISFGEEGRLKLIHDYNGHGEISAIRTDTNAEPLFTFRYNADGVLETMTVEPGSDRSFTRNFTYNEPGFLVQIDDPYLSERISYLETDSYGQDKYTPIYEGLISQTFFTAHWQPTVGALRNGIFPEYFVNELLNHKQAAVCFEALQQAGYLQNNQVNRTLYTERNDELPHICGDRIPLNHLAGVLSRKSFPQEYGHRYDYDDHDQMMKAKYFHGKEEHKLTPLTHKSFTREIPSVSKQDSKAIWDTLTSNEFLTTDCTNPSLCHGRPGIKSLFKKFVQQHRFSNQLEIMLLRAIADRTGVSEQDFERKCERWIKASHMVKARCGEAKALLQKHGVLGSSADSPLQALQEKFRNSLKAFGQHIPDIVRVLIHHFATGLGRSAADVQSYEIDANGNHRMFYTGFTRYRMEYREGTNQITKVHRLSFDRVQSKEQSFEMQHNSDGAVIKAEHKGIKHMEYDRILHRVSKIEMVDGRKVILQYDVRGERTFKQVLDAEGSVTHEKYYIRDAHGIVLVDMEMTYLASDQPPDVRVTSYLYKDQQLIGFVRNDQLYSVITDHEGSVRLVVKNGEVVAAYDYLPYGQIFRRYGTDFDGQISYLYTGQEWDEDIELYNYRARLYDPDIGRFYQMDPKEQYATPYVYAGNSPVSLVDPDGEFAFAITCFILALIGAYVGASSVARSWNPLQWDWKSKSLWLGMIGGALTGLSIPFNMSASVAYFVGLGLSLTTSISIMVCSGITLAYFSMAAASGSWNPADFDLTSPSTWNALLGGVAMAAFVVTNPRSLYNSFKAITTALGRALFVATKVGLSLTFAYFFAVVKMGGEFDVTKWDFTDPGLYYSMFDAFATVTCMMMVTRNLPNTARRYVKKISTSLDRFAESQVFFRMHGLMKGDWSSKMAGMRFFLRTNALAIANLQRGIIPIAFYAFILSLRINESYEKSPVPGFSVFVQILSAAVATKGFSNRIVKPILGRMTNQPLALALEGPLPLHLGDAGYPYYNRSSTSSAGRIETIFDWFHISYEWPSFASRKPQASSNVYFKHVSTARGNSHQHHNKPASFIQNCYRVSDPMEGMRDYVKCYSQSSIEAIHPKPHANLEASDHYWSCMPITYAGTPSISCDGERSNLLSMQLLPPAPKVFDYLDGWLLLARVAPAALREVKRLVQTVIHPPVVGTPVEQTEQQKDELEQNCQSVIRLSEVALGRWRMDWVKPLLEDVTVDVNEYLQYGRGSYSLLQERLEALGDDIVEEINLRKQTEQTFSYQQQGSSFHPSFPMRGSFDYYTLKADGHDTISYKACSYID
ncbi:uncharacterized protein LOC125952280 [Anopheles darlingi]|uniref:uncharacterized protein LOC125952280 n=1 Tax=Anopheles darlingi TaxID=43151 RepID=UPI002100438D|nr:uncharacterized protein LOC125952280 [Anopheles darlingi]